MTTSAIPGQVFLRIDKHPIKGNITGIKIFLEGLPSGITDQAALFKYPIRDSAKELSFFHLRLIEKEAASQECSEEDSYVLLRLTEIDSFTTPKNEKNYISCELDASDENVQILFGRLQNFGLLHVDLAEDPKNPFFPGPDDHQKSLNRRPQFGRFKVYCLDHGRGGTSGSPEP